MILYTALPLEVVLEGIDRKYDFREIEINNVKILVEPLDIDKGKIVSVISSNPLVYLNPKLYPGNIIKFNPS
ncbi:MAG: YlzJ-like family protein [Thermosediminibacteraceae bacterium]|nr:YlzJ-like family protein [Thermosediminibacteraceae bacterium]MCG0276843.1 YlzJ-like family protein [Thermosediminibacteraceae bacterium]